MAAVGAVVAVVAHDEVVALLHDLRAPVVVAAEFGRHVVVVQRDVVDVDVAVHDPDRVAFPGDHALDEHLLGVERVVEHDDVARTRLAELVDQLVDDQAIVILERRRHAQAVDARHLEAERDDERGVDGRRDQRLHAGDDFLTGARPGRGPCGRTARADGGERHHLEQSAGERCLDGAAPVASCASTRARQASCDGAPRRRPLTARWAVGRWSGSGGSFMIGHWMLSETRIP